MLALDLHIKGSLARMKKSKDDNKNSVIMRNETIFAFSIVLLSLNQKMEKKVFFLNSFNDCFCIFLVLIKR